MRKNYPVCILTAGFGTGMGREYSCINKTLLPLGNESIISNIISGFPKKTEFVIALGHLSKQVEDFLSIAHPKTKFTFVYVDNYKGRGSGPGYSLWCCKKHLNQPFYFVASDTIFKSFSSPPTGTNWAGVAYVPPKLRKKYCNFRIHDNRVIKIIDKKNCDDSHRAFTGFLFVKDHRLFWKGLTSKKTIAGERQISNGLEILLKEKTLTAVEGDWKDLGNKNNYQKELSKIHNFDFGKSGEFIYFENKKVIKFFKESNIINDRVLKANYNKNVFPDITDFKNQFYAYKFVEGKTMYSESDPKLFRNFLKWLEKSLWIKKTVDNEKMQKLCMDFYYKKTKSRLNLFQEKYKSKNYPVEVNGIKVFSIEKILNMINWKSISKGSPFFIHGDLQLDNVLYDKIKNKFTLLDWRQDFSGEIKFGDIYYDLAKLKGGLILNYDYIKLNLMYYQNVANKVTVDFARRSSSDLYIDILNDYILKNGFNIDKVNLIVGLIFLNMSPLHHFPFDKALYSISLLHLTNLINKKNQFIRK